MHRLVFTAAIATTLLVAAGSIAHAKSEIWTDSATKITYCVGKPACKTVKYFCTLGVFKISVFKTGLVTGSCAPPSSAGKTIGRSVAA